MKTILTLLFCLAIGSLTFAQKCAFTFEEIDSKTGLQKKRIMTAITNQFIVWTIKDGENYRIGLEITMAELQKNNIQKGDTLSFLLTNNETVNGIAEDKYLPIGKADEMTESSNYFPFYSVSASEWLKLCANNMQYIKVNLGKEYIGFEVNEGKAKKIKAAAVCVK